MAKKDDSQQLISRRRFIASSVAGAFILTTKFGETAKAQVADDNPKEVPEAAQLGTWLRIGTDESVTMAIGISEMGQGTMTGLAMLLAEDLMVDWAKVKVESNRASPAYGNPLYNSQMTVGSGSIRGYYLPLRKAGATARDMLIAAAAQMWNLSPAICSAANGKVSNTVNSQVLTYGQLASLAAQMPVPVNPTLVPDNALRYIGNDAPRFDIPAKIDGSAIYGMDVRLPDMVYAAVKHCPTFGGTLANTPSTPSGAIAVVPLRVITGTGRGTEATGMVNAVAAVAGDTWSALQAASRVTATWNIPPSSQQLNTDTIFAQAEDMLTNGTADTRIAEVVGNVKRDALYSLHRTTATYYLPYQADAAMEVLNCTVRITGEGSSRRCEIWAPTQSESLCVNTAIALTGLPISQIDVYTTFLGGGLGRKFEQDFISQAIQVALAINRPVKFMWSREEDYSRDQYRPMAAIRITAGLDQHNMVKNWYYQNCSPSISLQRRPTSTSVDGQAIEGATTATGLTYSFNSRLVKHLIHPAPIPVGYWRSVGHSINAFAVESMMDELAAAAGVDPYQFRRQHLLNTPRGLAVLDRVAAISNWGGPVPNGRARGIAFSQCFGSIVAQVVELSVVSGQIKLHNIWCVVDCGRAINPDAVKAQIEGGIVHGLNAALWERVTFTAGRSNVRNFNNTRKIKLREMPNLTIELIPTDPNAPIGGIGEPGVPCIAPAIANAYFRLTGNRVRTLPFFPR